MRNTDVTQKEYLLNEDATLMSTTDIHSHITYANSAFIDASGYEESHLMGEAHNVIRHPDMPPEAFGDMWFTIQQGDSWTGLVKNRRENGDHYWVRANVTPVYHNDTLTGYISVRNVPHRSEVENSDSLYQQVNNNGMGGFRFYKGVVVRRGIFSFLSMFKWLKISRRVDLAMVGGAIIMSALLAAHIDNMFKMAATLVLFFVLSVWLKSQLCRPLKKIVDQMQRVVSGRRTDYYHFDRVDEIGLMMRLVNQSGLNLHSLVDDVGTQIKGIRNISQKVSKEGSDLRVRSDETAAELQQTAAAVEEIASAVEQTAATAVEAMQMADTTSADAARGGDVMKQTLGTMKSISRDNSKIVDIIAVIDSIAFQTNILALNAAVEAARAAESGRGFAVVAQEVRHLAQHSASAAKEIKVLIEHNVANVNTGVNMVEQTESHLTTMIDNVMQMSTMIKEMGHATQEQTQALALINDSISRIGVKTQNNSGMVEHVTDAAEDLTRRTRRLQQAIQVFG